MSGPNTILEKPTAVPPYTPTALTLTRVLLTPILITQLRAASPHAPIIYLAACATDLLDGKAARHLGPPSTPGAALDASADFLLTAAGLTHFTLTGIVSPLLLILMAASFIHYIHTINLPIQDPLGKHVGTLLYALLGTLILAPRPHIGAAATATGAAYITVSLALRHLNARRTRHETSPRDGEQSTVVT